VFSVFLLRVHLAAALPVCNQCALVSSAAGAGAGGAFLCSVLEIFTGTGEVLSTRVYRGSPPHGHADAGIEFVALDGEATLERVAAYEMASIWDRAAQQAAAGAATAVPEEEALLQELEGLGLEGLDSLMAVADAHQQQLQLLEKVASLTSPKSLNSNNRSLSSTLTSPKLAGSLNDAQHLLAAAATAAATSNQVANKLGQLLLSPTAATMAGTVGSPFAPAPTAEMVPEEEMTADIFGLDELQAF